MQVNSLENCAVRSPDLHYRAHIATVYYISRPPLAQNPSSAPDLKTILMANLRPLHMSPVDRAGSVTGMNFALGSYEKF